MGAFIDTSKVAVTDGENTIWVLRRMTFGVKCRVEDTLTRIALKDGQAGDLQITLGGQRLALSIHNIVGWEGPAFTDDQGKTVPCTPETIERLDPDFPVFVKAREKIVELNAPREVVDPLASTTAGGPDSATSLPTMTATTST